MTITMSVAIITATTMMTAATSTEPTRARFDWGSSQWASGSRPQRHDSFTSLAVKPNYAQARRRVTGY
jgi:hypothetical protein